MPKAGSQTVEATLRPVLPGHQIERWHFLTPEGMAAWRSIADLPTFTGWLRENFQFQANEGGRVHHAVLARRLTRRVKPGLPKLPVIVGVREPIGLMLSFFFQIHQFFFPKDEGMAAGHCRDLLLGGAGVHPDQRRCAAIMWKFIDEWFDTELKAVFGIDVYQTSFPHARGYQVFETDLARVLVYRYENIASLDAMLGEFLGIAPPALVSRNVGSEKDYAARYDAVRRSLRLPAEFVQQQYNRRLAQHFYTASERETLGRRWAESAAAQVSAGAPPMAVETP
jgi:hypothetical protein